MKVQRISWQALCYVGLACVLWGSQHSHGESIFFDDFSDPVTFADTWTPMENWPGSYEAVPGKGLVLTPTRSTPAPLRRQLFVNAFEIDASDISITARVRKIQTEPGGPGGIWLIARQSHQPDPGSSMFTGYGAAINPTGMLKIARLSPYAELAVHNNAIDFDISQVDAMFRFDLIDNELSLWAWPAGEPMPVEAQVTVVDDSDTGASGFVGLLAHGGRVGEPNEFSQTVFRFVDVTVPGTPVLHPGDADQDLDFDQLDLVHVQVVAKYLTGQPATWGEGDWNGSPGGRQNNPPPGDGLFNQGDIVAALNAGVYLTGKYAAIAARGVAEDEQTSIGYDANTGEVWIDVPAGPALTSVNIDSAAGIFTGNAAENLGGSFDNDTDNNLFKATFGGSFGALNFGNVAQAGLSEEFLLDDLTVVGSLAGGGRLGEVDLIYIPVPEPSTILLAAVATMSLAGYVRRSRRR